MCVPRTGAATPSSATLPSTAPSSLPSELDGLNASLLFETDFDDESDFANSSGNDVCWRPDNAACEVKPRDWTNYYAAESWHPSDAQFATSEPVLSISSRFARGGVGKSMVVWDESNGGPSTWGSDAQLTKRLDSDVQDLYAQFWIRFQPGYRWHVNETSSGGQNLSKLLRVGHDDSGPGGTSYRFGSSGGVGPLVFLDSMVWARNVNGQLSNRGALLLSPRCDPQETSYTCSGASNGNGFFPNNASFEDLLGDGEWHKVAMRVKMNTSPGASDGLMAIWLDDTMLLDERGIRFKEAGSPSGLGWNSVGVGGNTHNYPENPSQRLEQWYSIDDVKVYSLD